MASSVIWGPFQRGWRAVKYLRAPVVNTRAELDSAIARAPRFIIVLGDEALRADAAALAYQGGQEAALLEAEALIAAGQKRYPRVAQLGRIKEGSGGYAGVQRVRRRRRKGLRGLLEQPGMATVLAAGFFLVTALTVELLSLPNTSTVLVRGNHPPHVAPKRGEVVRLPTHAPLPPPPSLGAQILHVVIPILAVLAAAALAYLIYDALRPGTVRVTWRVDHRIQGRLVIGRIKTRIA